VSRYGLEDIVSFHTEVPNADMPKYYSSAYMTLIPTRGVEGTSLSALESMACGTPTVCTNVGGLPDLPAVLVSPAPQSIADGILATAADHDLIAARQQQKVHKVYNSENWGNAWLDIISQVTS
jgi:glycosyltransferase involved in cell wall biosynthesis